MRASGQDCLVYIFSSFKFPSLLSTLHSYKLTQLLERAQHVRRSGTLRISTQHRGFQSSDRVTCGSLLRAEAEQTPADLGRVSEPDIQMLM